jgi:hypothetical protein
MSCIFKDYLIGGLLVKVTALGLNTIAFGLGTYSDAFFERRLTHRGHLPNTIDSTDKMLGLRSPCFWPLAAFYYVAKKSSIYDSKMCLTINDSLYCKEKDKSQFVKIGAAPRLRLESAEVPP